MCKSLRPQDEDKDVRDAHEDTQVTHEQAVAQAQDVDAPQAIPQVAPRRSSHLLQDHSQDLIIGSPSRGVTTGSRIALFIEHHAFVSLEDEPKTIEEALRDVDWIIAMQEEFNNFSHNHVWTLEERPKDTRVIGTKWVFRNKKDDQGKAWCATRISRQTNEGRSLHLSREVHTRSSKEAQDDGLQANQDSQGIKCASRLG